MTNSLSNTLPWTPQPDHAWRYPEHIPVLDFTTEGACYQAIYESREVILKVRPNFQYYPTHTEEYKKLKFLELLRSGRSLTKITHVKHSSSMKKMMADPTVRKEVEEIIESYTADPMTQRAYIRAARLYIAQNNLYSHDSRKQKLALEALDSMAEDPEIGLKGKQAMFTPEVGAGLRAVFDALREKEGAIIDVTPEKAEMKAITDGEEKK